LLPAEEAKARLREIVEGFFFRRLKRRGREAHSDDCFGRSTCGKSVSRRTYQRPESGTNPRKFHTAV
jgi:hypothetical protein